MPLQAKQLVALACQDARAPNYTSQAGQYLNMILSDLCQEYDFDLAKRTYFFNFNPGAVALVGNALYGSGPYPMPADYLRAAGDKAVFYTISGIVYFMIPRDLNVFDEQVQQGGNANFPSLYSTNVSPLDAAAIQGGTTPEMYVYPPPSGTFPVTVRYYCQMPDIAAPETSALIPWFPNQRFLRKRLAAMVMGLAGDDREMAWTAESDKILEGYLIMKDDSENRVKTVQLDRSRFGKGGYSRLKNTKRTGW